MVTRAASARATRRKRAPIRGRTLTAIALLAFILIASGVVWRRSLGDGRAREMRTMELERQSLVSDQKTLERDLEEATSRRRIVADAERRLSLHVATDAQTRVLPTAADEP